MIYVDVSPKAWVYLNSKHIGQLQIEKNYCKSGYKKAFKMHMCKLFLRNWKCFQWQIGYALGIVVKVVLYFWLLV